MLKKLSILAFFSTILVACPTESWGEATETGTPPSLETTPVTSSGGKVTHKRFGFSLEFPGEFEEVSTDTPGVGAALRAKGGGFPTLTVTIHPGRFSLSEMNDSHKRKERTDGIVASYRSVGITDAKLLDSRIITRATQNEEALQADLSYEREGMQYRSRVTIVPGDAAHYILTYIDKENGFETRSARLDAVLNKFERGEPLTPESKKRYPERERFQIILSGVVTLFALGFILWYHARRERLHAKNAQAETKS